MDFRQTLQPNPRQSSGSAMPAAPAPEEHRHQHMDNDTSDAGSGKWIKIFSVVMIVGIAILLSAIAWGIGRGPHDNESKFIASNKYQAVFLNSGQVYFGNIDSINDKYIHMTNIYYLTQSSSNSSSNSGNYTLVKLGCQQIHDPYDAMVINRAEVSFWENLQDNGKVVSSINQFKKQNPNGPDCSQVSNQTQATSSNAQGDSSTSNSNSNSSNNSNSSSK